MREHKYSCWDGVKMYYPGDEMPDKDSWYTDSLGAVNNTLDSGNGYKWRQFTGLQDKNGVDIYEGDLILSRDVRVSEVIFHPFSGCWDLALRSCRSNRVVSGVSPSSYHLVTEVIGNIYENPELLEGGA